MVQNKQRLWQPYSTGGGSLDKWTMTGSNYWSLFDQQVQKYGQPSEIWIQICELATHPLTFADAQQTVAILKQHVSTTVFYISQLNAYAPSSICALTGPNGVADSARLVNQTVSSGLALRGPILGPLTAQNTVSDMCHPNVAGEQLLGSELVAFFDK
jgi:hypothetical protein